MSDNTLNNPLPSAPSIVDSAPQLEPSLVERVPRGLRIMVGLVAIAVLAIAFAGAHAAWWHWFEVHTGTVNESGPYYGFWSGFGSDIGEATLVVGVIAAWRHHNCHVKRCPRLGRQVAGTPYVACPRHHPAHSGTRRGITHEMLHLEYHKAKNASGSN